MSAVCLEEVGTLRNTPKTRVLPTFIIYVNGWYKVQKVKKKKLTCYGSFRRLEDAVKHKDYCITHDWSSDCIIPFKNDKEDRYIQQLKGKFCIYKQVNGSRIYFGSFDTFEEAVNHRDYCENHGWSEECVVKKVDANPERYIKTNRYSFSVVHKSFTYGNFKTMEEAIECRDYCEEHDWSKDCLPDNTMKHIRKRGNNYAIVKQIGEKHVYFGSFNSLQEAVNHRDYCVAENWDVGKCKLPPKEPVKHHIITKKRKSCKKKVKQEHKPVEHINPLKVFIRKKSGKFEVRHANNEGESIKYGTFKTMEEAEKHVKYCEKRRWDEMCIIPPREKNIREINKYIFLKKNGGYYIMKHIRNKNVIFAHFNDLEEVRKYRDHCMWSGWNPKMIKPHPRHDRDPTLKYIREENGKYLLLKNIDGKLESFGLFNTLEEAQKEREWCIKCGWDWDLIVEEPVENIGM